MNNIVELRDLLTVATQSILAYKRRNDAYLPEWVDAIKFKRERQNETALAELRSSISKLEEENVLSKKYKGLLVASGQSLTEIVVDILRFYFGLDVKGDEKYVEDATVFDAGTLKFVVEIKGENGGLKRRHVNQVDNHRERLEVDDGVTGLLVLNDFADTDGIEERKGKQLSQDQLDYAKRQNVRVLRAVTLLELMLALEDEPNRAQEFLKRCEDGDPLVMVD